MKKGIALFLFFIGSINWMTAQEGIRIHEAAPMFKAIDQHGDTIDLAEELAENKVVLLFYRGQWCPYCNRHMSALQDSIHLINAKGARVIAVTPENQEAIEETMTKTGAKFSIIYDKHHQIMDAWDVTFNLSKSKHVAYQAAGININHASGNNDRALPVPATYIISSEGIVTHRHFDKNYKQRMSIQEILDNL
ncbi:AhpC/TSA family protein [Carboxylicivirga mesophila]|uniref:thioredoxin-dependent peroxiredoxin n=1 Tax=Carboxylicivirga mesophila TaxID=1166478 RepID=A0ABS5K696_9BACT|nr:peroxiredoxin-like family protein [Carboxylicivirga mesophila]MBS2210476.1 AhpC/TSA family protein [Carboxylicivirga mesophila]